MTSSTASARRDTSVIALIAGAHMTSHFFQLALPPLFPLLKAHFDVSYTALGALMSVFYALSGLCQAPAGILVDRFGGRRVLIAGAALLAAAIGLAGLVPQFWMLFALAAFAGIGNSVFHPADYSILSHGVSKARLGRAYSIHALGGTLGYAISPVVVGAFVHLWSWPVALGIAGLVGFAVVAVIARSGNLLGAAVAAPARPGDAAAPAPDFLGLLAHPGIVAGFAYFTLSAMVSIGMQNGGVPALVELYAVPLDRAAWVLTGFLIATACGMLVGGFVADRTTRHDALAIGGLLTAACAILAIAALPSSFALVIGIAAVAGLALGITYPARDMLIRAAAPPGATGRVFGMVYSGLDLGSASIPVIAGWLLDSGAPRAVFLVLAAALLLTVATVIRVRRSAPVQAAA